MFPVTHATWKRSYAGRTASHSLATVATCGSRGRIAETHRRPHTGAGRYLSSERFARRARRAWRCIRLAALGLLAVLVVTPARAQDKPPATQPAGPDLNKLLDELSKVSPDVLKSHLAALQAAQKAEADKAAKLRADAQALRKQAEAADQQAAAAEQQAAAIQRRIELLKILLGPQAQAAPTKSARQVAMAEKATPPKPTPTKAAPPAKPAAPPEPAANSPPKAAPQTPAK
ncbi:MAG: hypothetical protein D6744_01105, partial [Planctomycetota bacterium]